MPSGRARLILVLDLALTSSTPADVPNLHRENEIEFQNEPSEFRIERDRRGRAMDHGPAIRSKELDGSLVRVNQDNDVAWFFKRADRERPPLRSIWQPLLPRDIPAPFSSTSTHKRAPPRGLAVTRPRSKPRCWRHSKPSIAESRFPEKRSSCRTTRTLRCSRRTSRFHSSTAFSRLTESAYSRHWWRP